MSKKIAIFCDGTWNDLSLENRTNVVRLAKCVAPVSRDHQPQIVYYDEGVGVGSNVSFVADTLTKVLGGALGRGLDRKIEAAYRFLVLNYDVGDDIYVFGFSRGAYTARSLCGLIRKCGILRRDCFQMTPEALRLYRGPRHPKSPEIIEFRKSHAYLAAAGDEDHQRVGITLQDIAEERSDAETRASLYQYRPEPTYRMMYVGVWDTVGAMGIPSRFDILKLNRRYAFHDTSASTLLSSVRHAIAANEKRGLFDVTEIDNIHELNAKWAKMTGWDVDDPSNARHVPYRHRPYQQQWLPGDHCSIGGGHKELGLSSIGLRWIAEGAEWAGLTFTNAADDELGTAGRLANSCAELGERSTGERPGGEHRRRGPTQPDEIADAAWDRAARDGGYRPPNLTVMKGRWSRGMENAPAPAGFPAAPGRMQAAATPSPAGAAAAPQPVPAEPPDARPSQRLPQAPRGFKLK